MMLELSARGLLLLNGLLNLSVSTNYFRGQRRNAWPMLEALYKKDVARQASSPSFDQPADTANGEKRVAWMALMPFYASLYAGQGLFCLMAAGVFRKKELGLSLLLPAAAVHAVQAFVRLNMVPQDMYQEGKAAKASRAQYVLAAVLAAVGAATVAAARSCPASSSSTLRNPRQLR
jgi:hypothetical protein